MNYVLDPTNQPGLIVVATDDPDEADRVAALYSAETSRPTVIAIGPAVTNSPTVKATLTNALRRIDKTTRPKIVTPEDDSAS
jgi:hypothetical protein